MAYTPGVSAGTDGTISIDTAASTPMAWTNAPVLSYNTDLPESEYLVTLPPVGSPSSGNALFGSPLALNAGIAQGVRVWVKRHPDTTNDDALATIVRVMLATDSSGTPINDGNSVWSNEPSFTLSALPTADWTPITLPFLSDLSANASWWVLAGLTRSGGTDPGPGGLIVKVGTPPDARPWIDDRTLLSAATPTTSAANQLVFSLSLQSYGVTVSDGVTVTALDGTTISLLGGQITVASPDGATTTIIRDYQIVTQGIDASQGQGLVIANTVQLVPTAATGHPASGFHNAGELIMDSVGAVFGCTVAGTPGTWVQFTVS